AVDVLPSLTVMAELVWFRWSGFRGGAPDLRVLVDLGITPPLLRALFPAEGFRDTFVPRLGLEWRRPVHRAVDVAARAGVAWEPSPVPGQTGLTSFADNDRVVVGAGAGLE